MKYIKGFYESNGSLSTKEISLTINDILLPLKDGGFRTDSLFSIGEIEIDILHIDGSQMDIKSSELVNTLDHLLTYIESLSDYKYDVHLAIDGRKSQRRAYHVPPGKRPYDLNIEGFIYRIMIKIYDKNMYPLK